MGRLVAPTPGSQHSCPRGVDSERPRRIRSLFCPRRDVHPPRAGGVELHWDYRVETPR
jgi:hypothetical protein